MSDRKRIFIVEPDPGMRLIYTTLLSKRNFEVEFGSDGEIQKAINFAPHLIIIEVMGWFPNVPFTVFARYKAAFKGPIPIPVPIVVITSSNSSSDRVLCERGDVTEYHKKPIGLYDILEIVHRVLK